MKRYCGFLPKNCLWVFVSALVVSVLAIYNISAAFTEQVMIASGNSDVNKNRLIRVVMDDNYPPYVFRDSSGSVKGILPDQWHLWEKYTGIRVEIIATQWEEAQRVFNQGRADVIDTIFFTPKRAKVYDFTKPYASIPVSIFFDRTISSIPDCLALRGYAVAVKSGDACISELREKGVNSLVHYPSYEAIIEDAAAGLVKVFCMDDPPALYLLRKYKIADKFRKGFKLYTGEFQRAVQKGQTGLIALIENGFKAIPKKELKSIDDKWLGIPLGVPSYYRYIMLLLTISVSILIVALAWNISLERLVRQKTKDLRKLLAETKEKEELLRETKECLELALEGAELGTWDWDIKEKRVARNDRWAEMLGYDSKGVASDSGIWLRLLHPEDRERVLNAIHDHLSGKTECYEEEYRLRHASGRWVWVLDRGKIIKKDPDGIPVRMAGVNVDVTRRKRMETTLRLLNQAVEQSPVSIMITDLSGTIEYVNPKFCEVTGYDNSEVIGLNPRILKSGKTSQEVYKDLWESITAGKQWHGILCNRKKSGDLYWENSSICPIVDEKGAITHFVAVKEDITEKIMLEKQLIQAQKLESIGRLAGGIAHDISNVLSIIIGNIQLIMMELEKDHSIYQSCSDILEAGRRCRNLIRQLMAFARKQTVKPVVLDLNEAIGASEKMLEQLVGEDIEIKFVPDPRLWKVKIDPNQLDQILTNLAVNSRDAIPDVGSITIKTKNIVLDENYCKVCGDFEPGDYVLIVFEDSGSGMEKDVLDHIFEPFFTTKDAAKGTGLGLSTVYGIVKQNGGFINVWSEPGKGTRFNIYLPRCVSEGQEDISLVERRLTNGKGTILVVDDDEPVLRVCKRVLTRLGYDVMTAKTPLEAISVFETRHSDIQLLLTDVVMPTMNGRELKERVERMNSKIKTLFMSGYTGDIIADRGVLADGINYIEKPFSAEELAEKVQKLLKN